MSCLSVGVRGLQYNQAAEALLCFVYHIVIAIIVLLLAQVSGVLPSGTPVFAKTLFSMCTPDVDDWLKAKPDVKQVGWQLTGLAVISLVVWWTVS